jgi:cytochrome P450
MEAITMRSRLGSLRVLHFDRKATQSFKICRQFAERIIDYAVQRRDADPIATGDSAQKQKYRVVNELVRQTTNRRQIRDELINGLIAGRDTTAGLLSNLFFLLAKHQEAWTKLQDEVSSALNGRLPNYEDLRQMKYLRYCLNEGRFLLP